MTTKKYELSHKISFKTEVLSVLIILASLVLGIYFYRHFPAQVAIHWGFGGQADRFGEKLQGAFLLPLLLLGIYILFLALPLLDPKKDRYADFAKVYQLFKTLIILALFGIFVASGLYNLGYNLQIKLVVPLLIGLLMIFLGNYMGKIKSNWFVGIRTPWTLSSENVWNRTHRFGGWMFMLFGLLLIISPLLPKALVAPAFIIGAALVVLGTFAYSYMLYKKEQNGQKI